MVLLALMIAGAMLFSFGCADPAEPEDPADNGEEPDTPDDPDEEEPTDERGDLVWSHAGDPVWLNPVLEQAGSDIRTNKVLFDQLIVLNEEAEPEGQLAADWEISDDGHLVTVNLVENAYFHDGEPLTAEDVVFTYSLHLNPEVPTRYGSDLWPLVGFEELTDEDDPADFEEYEPVVAADEYTVEFHLDFPFAGFVTEALTLGIVPKHVIEAQMEGDTAITEIPFNANPVGSGPFVFNYWDHENEMIFDAFEDYHQGHPGADRYIRRVIPDPTVRAMEQQAGSIDVMAVTDVDVLADLDADPDVDVYAVPGFGYRTLAVVNDHPLWEDSRVREAIAYGIDQQSAVELYGGPMADLAADGAPIGPISWAHHPDLEARPHDPDRALELLADAGWEQDDNGVLRNDAGEAFEFDLLTFPGVERHDMNLIFQENLRGLGMEVGAREVAAPDLMYQMYGSDHRDMIFIGWSMSVDPDGEMWRRWHSDEDDHNNFYNFRNDRVDELLEMARFETDQDVRRDYYHEVQEILDEELPGINVFYSVSNIAFRSNFHGMRFGADGWQDFIHAIYQDPIQ